MDTTTRAVPRPSRSLARTALAACLVAALVATGGVARAQVASAAFAPDVDPQAVLTPGWEGAFGVEPGLGTVNGTQPRVYCSAVFDDGLGDGPVLYVGGLFDTAGGVPVSNLARWDGSSWSDPGGASNTVWSMSVYDDGNGERLYLGGAFQTIGGAAIPWLAAYDGVSFAPVGAGVDGLVFVVHTFTDGGAQYLGVGGQFTTAGGAPANRAALLFGTTWVPFGDGFDDDVHAFEIHDGAIYAGGEFQNSGANPVSLIARWNGSNWEDVDGGLAGTSGRVYALQSYGVGTTFGLYVGGKFDQAGGTTGIPAANFARWQAGTWTEPDGGIFGRVRDLQVWDDGGGEDLYLAGSLGELGSFGDEDNVLRFDGTTLTSLDDGVDEEGYSLVVHDDGSGESLWVTGAFRLAGGLGANAIARWDGAAWDHVLDGLNDSVNAVFASSTFLGGPTLFVGGDFATPGTVFDRGIAAWQAGVGWIPMDGIPTRDREVNAIAEFDDGGGPRLFVGGNFTQIGGVSASRIAAWDGSTWSQVGGGLAGTCETLAVYDDGGGPALYAGGSFSLAGGAPVQRIARWDGSAWSAVGTNGPDSSLVYDLEVYDDGNGPALFVGGSFDNAGGVYTPGIARWDGSTWSGVGGGVTTFFGFEPGTVNALEVYDDGCGNPGLYVGGGFTAAGGVPDSIGLARWDGSTWTGVAPLGANVASLCAFDDGSGPSLFVGGSIFNVQGSSPFVARFNGAGFGLMGGGVSSFTTRALGVFDDGVEGPRLVVGGDFTSVPDTLPTGASRLAYWNGLPDGFSTWTDLGFALAGVSGDPLLTATGALSCGSTVDLALTQAAPSEPAGLFLSATSTPTPFAGGTLIPVPWLGPYLFTTTPTGTLLVSSVIPEGLPPGFELFVQYAINDGAAPFGKSLSNALRGDVP